MFFFTADHDKSKQPNKIKQNYDRVFAFFRTVDQLAASF